MLKLHLLCPGRAHAFPKEPWMCLTAAPMGCKAEQSISVSSSRRLRCLLFFCSLWLYPYWSHPANSTSQIQLEDCISFSITVLLSSSLCLLGSFFLLCKSVKERLLISLEIAIIFLRVLFIQLTERQRPSKLICPDMIKWWRYRSLNAFFSKDY